VSLCHASGYLSLGCKSGLLGRKTLLHCRLLICASCCLQPCPVFSAMWTRVQLTHTSANSLWSITAFHHHHHHHLYTSIIIIMAGRESGARGGVKKVTFANKPAPVWLTHIPFSLNT
jgi:hypothetical protein